jgi:hypothetical protein
MLAADVGERYDDTSRLARDLEYHIYHTGYGPTVVTLEDYLCRHFTYLNRAESTVARRAVGALEQTVALNDYLRHRATDASGAEGKAGAGDRRTDSTAPEE